MLDVTVYLKLD